MLKYDHISRELTVESDRNEARGCQYFCLSNRRKYGDIKMAET